MNKAKLFNLLYNLAILANVAVGFFKIHWAIIVVFVVIHAMLRFGYLNAQSQATDSTTQTVIAPPLIRNIASVITAIIVAGVAYGVGFGLALLVA